MKIVFNDATELQVQSVYEEDGRLVVKTIAATTDELRAKLSDELAVKRMDVHDQGVLKATYEGYTELYRLEEYSGTIRGAILYRTEKSPESIAESVKALQMESKEIKEQNESLGEKVDEAINAIKTLSECMKKILTGLSSDNLLAEEKTE